MLLHGPLSTLWRHLAQKNGARESLLGREEIRKRWPAAARRGPRGAAGAAERYRGRDGGTAGGDGGGGTGEGGKIGPQAVLRGRKDCGAAPGGRRRETSGRLDSRGRSNRWVDRFEPGPEHRATPGTEPSLDEPPSGEPRWVLPGACSAEPPDPPRFMARGGPGHAARPRASLMPAGPSSGGNERKGGRSYTRPAHRGAGRHERGGADLGKGPLWAPVWRPVPRSGGQGDRSPPLGGVGPLVRGGQLGPFR